MHLPKMVESIKVKWWSVNKAKQQHFQSFKIWKCCLITSNKMKNKILKSILIFTIAIIGFSDSLVAQKIAGGNGHSLSICSDNTIRAWGDNGLGQLGNGTITPSNVPVSVSSLTGVIAIAAGSMYSHALKNDGTVWSWGDNTYGHHGNGTNTVSFVPIQVSGLSGAIAIAAGLNHSLALKNDGTVWSWGRNTTGQLGNGTTTNSNLPVQVNGLSGIIAISAGRNHSIALKNDGTVWAWGQNNYSQLGNGTTGGISNIPVQVNSITGITAITGGAEHCLALKNDSTVWAWGNNFYGELGNGANKQSNVPVSVISLTSVTAIAAGGLGYHSLALKNDGTVRAWGFNGSGQLGNGTLTNTNVPILVTSLTGIIGIAGNNRHSISQKNDLTIQTMGMNSSGQLGNGTYTNSNLPVQVKGLCVNSTAIQDNLLENLVSVYPNPTIGIVTISSTEAIASIDVFDVTGKLVYSQQNNNKQTNSSLDLSNLSNGIYFIHVHTENGGVRKSKVVVSK